VAGLARVWLGVHFLSDVVAGLALGTLLLALRAPLAKLAARPFPWAGLLIASALSAWLTQSTALAGLAMFTLGLVSGNLLSLERSPTPALPAALLTLAGGLVVAGLLFLVPALTSSSLLILAGQGWLFGCLGFWLSAGLWWSLSAIRHGARTGRSTPR
jgi:undecaprenyl-diphosphatase